ncbi:MULTISPECIES: DUF5329 domain-containing protein [Stenotrophomonas]|jgi:hypothetical protein|uniref:DUF5329 domain-containing protein n=1 Tax=Stenotrophomonas TaxID=40323 RepID=UPI000BCDB7EC|nr:MULTISPECIES: DUF5329 domain-containing protein [Stenotrophomonas]MCA7024745.1 DUF5329 domain-containing protein [Stenotrophomonas acidaminiphila]MCE4074497.1 DUF5329 domain-containing protein [Stenotrophomonas acidaminiphila]OZB67493.1 MAG: hypothetical protein B7X39_05920 [Xanthomonadales bacterium 14-68-21]
MTRGILLAMLLGVAVVPSTLHAAPGATARAEIGGLMQALEDSGCRFQRNGSWHDAAEARSHLQRKYDYLLKRGLADSAEQFIERAASRSSISGKPYRVACPGRAEQDAAPWFRQQLLRLRGG